MIISSKEFSKIRKQYGDKKIVYCDGSFDMCHAGHVLFFEDCKKHGDIIVAGVGADADLKVYKGDDRPILNEVVRMKTIDSFKPVDYCFLNKLPTRKNLLSHLQNNFKKLRPDIYAVNSEAFDIPYRRKIAKKYNVKFVILERNCPKEFEFISTTKIIEKIKNLTQG